MPIEPTWEETTAIEEPTWENTTEGETKSPGYLGPEWPAQEGEAIASDPERERKREELANQMRLARAERGLSDVIESFLSGAARAVEPLTPAGLMNQPTRIAAAIAGKPIPDIYQAGQPLVNVPQPSGTGFLAGLGQLGAQTLSGLTTPEMVVTAPAFPVSGAARALTAGQMAATLPESISRGGEVLRSPEATVAEKVVAAGQPLVTAAMIKALTKAERILPQAAEAVRETKGVEDAIQERSSETIPVGEAPGDRGEVGARVPEPEKLAEAQAEAVQAPSPPTGEGRVLLTELTPEQKLAEQRALDEALGQETTAQLPVDKGIGVARTSDVTPLATQTLPNGATYRFYILPSGDGYAVFMESGGTKQLQAYTGKMSLADAQQALAETVVPREGKGKIDIHDPEIRALSDKILGVTKVPKSITEVALPYGVSESELSAAGGDIKRVIDERWERSKEEGKREEQRIIESADYTWNTKNKRWGQIWSETKHNDLTGRYEVTASLEGSMTGLPVADFKTESAAMAFAKDFQEGKVFAVKNGKLWEKLVDSADKAKHFPAHDWSALRAYGRTEGISPNGFKMDTAALWNLYESGKTIDDVTKPTPLPKGTPTEPSAGEPSQLTPAQQGSMAQVSTPNVAAQATVAPFLDIPPDKWTPEYWKRIGDEGRRTVRSNLQGALQKLGSKTKITERSSPQAVFNAIAEVNKARTEPPPSLPPGPGAKTVGEPPYAAAQQLTDQLRATPPTGTKDAYTIRQKLADTWAQGKTIFERALGASRATAETLKDTARGVRAITDLDRRVGELDWLLQKSAGQSRNLSKAIIAQQKSKTTREAIALWIDAGGDVQVLKDTLANLPASTRPNIRRALETAVNLPPEARQFAQQIEQFYGIRLNDARESEIFEKSLDDYFTHIWQKESNMPDKLRQAYSTGRVNDYFQFARQRKLPMFLDGILQGKTPELDPAKVLPYYNYALDRSIASRQFVKELSEVNAPDGRPAVLPTGTARRLEPNEEGAKGGIFINPKGKGEMGKDYHVIDHPAMRKWKWLGADEQGNPVMYRSDLAANPLVHERLARMLDQRLATPSKVGKALLRASTEVKGFKLGLLSAFHQVHVGSHALFHWTSPFKTGEIDWESPAVRYAVEKGHLKLAGDASQIAQFSEGLLSPGLVHKVPIVGPWSKAYSEWLFTDYIPRLKLKTFENALPRNLAWFAKDIAAGKITKEQVAARVGDAVNNAYGELNHWFLGKYGRSPQFQRILRGIFLAPDFGEARLRFVEKAFTKYGWEERMAFATMFLTLYAGARVANWLSHGDPETDLKNAFRVKVKIPGKDQMEWVSMRSVVGDLAHALTGFGQFMYVRLNPLYSRTISDILFQRDVYGRKLSFGDIAFKRPAQQLVPINFTGLTREDQSLWESAVTSAGLQVQHDVPAMDIGKLKRKWLLSNPDPKLRSMGEKNEASLFPPSDYSPLRRALASGDLKQAGAEYDALLTEKKKKHSDIVDALSWYTGGKEVNGVYHERKIKPIGGQIGVDAEKKFLASLTPAERRLYAQALEERKRIYGKFLELMKSR